jgi:hypothetical protein
VVSAAGSVICLVVALLLFGHLRTIVAREVSRGLRALLTVLIIIGSAIGAVWAALLFVNEVVATFFAYPPMSILAGMAVNAANRLSTGQRIGLASSVSRGSTSMLAELIAAIALGLLIMGVLAVSLWALFWFRRMVNEAIRRNMANADSATQHAPSPPCGEPAGLRAQRATPQVP